MSELGWSHLTRQDKQAILRGIEDGVAYGGPYHVDIHPADRCNIDCFFCSTAALRGTDEVPMPRFEELLGELKEAGTRSIRLSGGGEPLFHRRIRDFLRALLASGLPIENITTNAVSYCLIGWHSMLIRTTGAVAPCCILQGKELGNIYRQSLRDVWHGEEYNRFRAELSRILREGPGWRHDPASDHTVDGLCGVQGACPVGTFYYQPDLRFRRSFNQLLPVARSQFPEST